MTVYKRVRIATNRRSVLYTIRHKPDDPRTIYFIQCETTGLIKIGLANDVRSRLSTMQGCCPTKLNLIAHFDGLRSQERELHLRFAEHKARGEWFKPAPDILEYIVGLNFHAA